MSKKKNKAKKTKKKKEVDKNKAKKTKKEKKQEKTSKKEKPVKKESKEEKISEEGQSDEEKRTSVKIKKPNLDKLVIEAKNFYKFLKEKHILSNAAWVLAFMISLTVMDYAFQYWNNSLSVAIVGGNRVSRNEYMKRAEQLAGLQAVEELVNDELVRLKAQKEGVEVEDKEVQEIIDQDIKSVGSEEELRKLIADYPAMNMEIYREDIRIGLLELKLFKRYLEITDDELEQFFEANKQYLFPEQEDVKFEDKKEDVKEIYLDYKLKNDMQARNEWYASLREEFTVRNNFTDDVSYGFMKATRQAYTQFLDQVADDDKQDTDKDIEKILEEEKSEKTESEE